MATEDTNEDAVEATGVETPETETPKPHGDVPPEVKAALRKANKEAQDLRLKLQTFEDRDKTEAQKLTDRAEAAEKRAVDLESRALRLEVASERGLTSAQARRLVGSTREELEADAAELLETFKPPSDGREVVVDSLDLGPRSTTSTAGNPASDFAQFMKKL